MMLKYILLVKMMKLSSLASLKSKPVHQTLKYVGSFRNVDMQEDNDIREK